MDIKLMDMIDKQVIDMRNLDVRNEFLDYISQQKTAEVCKVFLARNHITSIGVRYFSKANWSHLTHLSFISNKITDQGCKHLSRISLPMITLVALDSNEIGDAGMLHLSKAQWASLCEGFTMHQNKLRNGCINLFTKGNFLNCQKIDLSKNQIKRAEIMFLMLSEAKSITFLRINQNIPAQHKAMSENNILDKFRRPKQSSFFCVI